MTEKRLKRPHRTTASQQLNMLFFWIIASFGITNADHDLFSCDFERQCILSQERRNDQFDWTLHNGVTQQWFTGPSSDHTVGDDTGHYFYAQSDINNFGTTAQLFSPTYNLTKKMVRLEFYYHMYDARYPDNMGTLNVYAHPCGSEQLVFSRTGNQGYLWKKAEIELHCNKEVQIAFEAVRGGTESDIAIDDIKLIDIYDNTSPTATQLPFTEEPITDSVTRFAPWTAPVGATDPIKWPIGTAPSVLMTTPTKPTTAILENTSISRTEVKGQTSKSAQTPKMKTEDKGEGSPHDGSSTPETTLSTAIWGPPDRTIGESTAIIATAVAVGVLCVLILILIVIVWKTRRGKNEDKRRGEMYENQAFNRSQDLQLHNNDPSYTALQFSRSRSTAPTMAAPAPPKRRQTPAGKYIGLRKPNHDHSLSKHSSGISTISTTRSANSNDFGSTMDGSIGIYEAVESRRGRGRGPRRIPSEFLGNPVYIGGSENDLEIRASAKLPAGRPPGPLEPKYYTVLPDVVDSLQYKVRISKAQTVPCNARTWHISDHYPASEDSDVEVGSKESVYADIDDTRSSLSDCSIGELHGNIYGPYEIEC